MNAEIQKQFVSHEIAVRLKFLGFDEPCLAFYQAIPSNDNTDNFDMNFVMVRQLFSRIETITNTNTNFGWNVTVPLWQQAISFINDLLCENGKTKRICFFDNIQAEQDVLESLALIEIN